MSQTTADYQEHDSLPKEIVHLLHSSLYNHDAEYTKSLKKCFQILVRDPYLMKARPFDLSDEQNRELTMRQIRRVFHIRNKLLKNESPQMQQAFLNVLNMYDRSLHMRLYVHFILFKETLWSQGGDTFGKSFADKIERGEVLGCFSMTELGHSSYLRGIETVATFDKEHDEFVIETTKLTGTKWWIGIAGQVATHTVALAQLRDHNGMDHGLYWFLVPMRDPNTGELLPGVTAGHLGAKAGRSGLDNGWIQFSQCRVPRSNLLQRFVRMERDGTIVKTNSNPSLSYMTLVGERIVALRAAFNMLSQAATISVRYGVLRKQGPKDEKIMDYQSHYFNLMPVVCGSYALQYMHNRVLTAWQEAQQRFISQRQSTAELAEEIQYFHALSAGSKTFLCWWVADALEACRRSGGGHFYSAYNNIASIIADYAVITTGGGDNFVLGQQCARYLLNQYKRAFSGKSVHSSLSHLKDMKMLSDKKLSINRASDISLEKVLESFQWLSLYLLTDSAKILTMQGKNAAEYWNDHIMEMVQVGEPYVYFQVLEHLRDFSEDPKNEPIRSLMREMGVCFGLSLMEKLLDRFLVGGYMRVEEVAIIRKARTELCKELRRVCIPLVDSFGYPDEVLKSPMASYDTRKAYENYFDLVKGNSYVAPYWEKEVRSLLMHQSRL